jgi:hypothetical protein
MSSRMRHWISFGFFAALALTVTGCPARGIGDPCVPEVIPGSASGTGYSSSEVYLETSSVQCRTRTCMVFKLGGDPSKVVGEDSCPPGSSANCVRRDGEISATDSLQRVFCSCRCSTSDGNPNTPLCNCTDGFHCVQVVTGSNPGLNGGYCVPNDLCTANTDCASGNCNLESGFCVNTTT